MPSLRLKVTDPQGNTREWRIENVELEHRKSVDAYGITSASGDKLLYVLCDLLEPLEATETKKAASLEAADEVAASVIKNHSKDVLEVLYCRLYDGLSLRIDAARATIQRLRTQKA